MDATAIDLCPEAVEVMNPRGKVKRAVSALARAEFLTEYVFGRA